jgi:hypothetical protein
MEGYLCVADIHAHVWHITQSSLRTQATGVCMWTHHLAAHIIGLSFKGCNRQCRRLGAISTSHCRRQAPVDARSRPLFAYPHGPYPGPGFWYQVIWKAITAAADVVHQCLSHKFSASIEIGVGIMLAQILPPPFACSCRSNSPPKSTANAHTIHARGSLAPRRCYIPCTFL